MQITTKFGTALGCGFTSVQLGVLSEPGQGVQYFTYVHNCALRLRRTVWWVPGCRGAEVNESRL